MLKYQYMIPSYSDSTIVFFYNSDSRGAASEDQSEKSIRRSVWRFLHKNLGRATLLLALVNISLGLFMALSHQVWYIG